MADNYEIEVTLEETFGTGIRSVEQTSSSSASGGLNEITVTLTNDQQNKFYIMNGLKGEDGKDGRDGSSPIAVTTAEQMTDHSQIYLYGGNEEGYTARHLYYWNGSEWADYGLYGMPDTYLSTASIENETDLDQHGNTVSTSTTLGITGRILSNPAYYEFVQKLYSVSGENEDGALTQKATSEAIDAAQFLPILNHPIAPVGDNYLSASLVPNVLNVLNGVGYTFTEVNLTLSGAKENTLTRWFVRFTTGGNEVTDFDFPGTVTVPSGFSLKTQTTYDIVIENGVAHIWEDGNAVGNVLDAEATADAVADWLDDHPEATTTVADSSITTAKLASGVIDNTLLVSGAAADSKKVGDEINDLKSQIEQGGGGLTADVKSALMDVVNHIGAWTDGNAQTYIGALQSALYPPANLTSISAVFTQGSAVIYDTDSLETLRQYLVVTAHYSDNTSETVTTYTLSGTLTEGTSTITASYGGKSATFNVVVSESWTYTWEYTDGLPENNGLTKTVNGTVSIAMESNGLRIAVTESDSNDVKYEYNKNVATKHTRIVYEIGLIPVALSTVNGRGIRMNTGIGGTGADAAYGTQLALNVNGIQYLGQASGWSLLTSNTLSLNEESKIKIDQIDGSADIYVNETLVGTITSFREKIGFPALQFRNVNETIFRSFKVRCID